jgi:hypothetical protein
VIMSDCIMHIVPDIDVSFMFMVGLEEGSLLLPLYRLFTVSEQTIIAFGIES